MKHTTKRLAALLLAAVMVIGLLPATALAAPRKSSRADGVTIYVTDYGADPTGTKESSTAVIKALKAAKDEYDAATPKTIVFPKGEYHFYEEYSETKEWYVSNTLRWDEAQAGYAQKHVGILVEGMENVTIDGDGSLFMFHGNMTTMAAVDSKNVTFKNFSEDFACPEVVDVTVESHEGENVAILFVPACYNFTINGTNINWSGDISPVTGQAYWSANNGYLSYKQYVDTISGRHVSDGKYPFDNVSALEKVDDTHIKVTYSNASSRPPVGQSCQMRHPNPRKTPCTFFWQSENITVQNANFYFLHGFGMVGQLSKTITLDHVNCVPRPGTGRTSAGFADFVQMSSIGGDVTIKNCNFADPHDDPINVHGTFLKVAEIQGNRVKVTYNHYETWGFPQYYVGNTVDFTVQNTLAHVENSECTVTAVDNPGEGTNLDGSARSKTNENDMKSIIVTLDHIPAGIGTGHVMENVSYIPNVTIENCHFTEVPTRAILVTSSKRVRILNNYFDRIRTSTIFISNDAQEWYESGRTEDVLIQGNTFIAQSTSNRDDKYGYSAIIMVWPTNGSNDPNYQIHKKMRIEDNTFYILDGMPTNKTIIAAKSVNGLSITGNTFLRYQPDVAIKLTASSTTVAPGGTQATSRETTGNSFTQQMFRLQACKDITFEGNTYDDGLNLGIKLDETAITTNDQIQDNDNVLAVNGNNQLDAVGTVTYYSDNPAVATVDANGVVTGVKAGTANITAFRTVAGRTFASEPLTFTVGGEAVVKPSKIEISGADTVNVNTPATYTATATTNGATSTDGIAWAVKPVTDGAEAEIENGVLTATAPGVVEVTASKGGVTASKLVTVKSPLWEVVNPSSVDGAVTVSGDGTRLTLKCTSTGGDFNPDGSGANDRYLMDTPAGDFSVSVKMETRAKTNWQESGLVIFKDADHYVNLTSKSRGGSGTWLALISENGDHPAEPHISQTDEAIWVKLERTGTTFKGYYRVNKGDEWTQFVKTDGEGSDTPTNDSVSGSVKVGLYASNSGGTQTDYSFSDFRLNNELILFNATAPMPVATDVSISANDTNHSVDLTYTCENENSSLIRWYVSDTETGHFTPVDGANAATLTVTAATSEKYVKAVVVPCDATGRYGAPMASDAVRAPEAAVVQNDATLASLSVTGLTLSPAFDPNVTQYTVNVPATVSSVAVNAVAAQTGTTVVCAENVTLDGAETTATVKVTAPDDSTTKTYTITIYKAQSSDATLTNLTATAGSASITYNANTRFYELISDGTELTFTAMLPAGGTLETHYNGEEKQAMASGSLPLKPGLNYLELRVTAADGISTALYRVRVLKPAASNVATLSALTVNDGDVLNGMEDNEALVRLGAGVDAATITATATEDDKATVHISVDGKPVNSGASATLTKAVTTATVRVVAEDGVTENVYTITLIKNDPTSAELYKLDLGKVALSAAFDASKENYTAVNYGNLSTTLTAVAAQTGAKITYETVDDYAETEDAQISETLTFYKGTGLTEDGKTYNTVIVKVTSPDGKHTKTYTVKVEVVESVYLSDLNWAAAETQYGTVRKDEDIDGNPISLRVDEAKKEYAKGICAHANATVVYDLSSMGFNVFSTRAGISYYQATAANNQPDLKFRVLLGDHTQADAEVNQKYMENAPESFTVHLNGAQTMTLSVTTNKGNNHGAHGIWADAKLYTTITDIGNVDIPIKHLELEHDSHTVYANTGRDDHTATLHPVVKPIGVALSKHQTVLVWSSGDTNIATVSQDAQLHQATVTGQKAGTTTITVQNSAKTLSDTCDITVKWALQGTPFVNGDKTIGSRLTAALNDMDQDAKGNVTVQWQRKGASDSDFADISGATTAEYDVPVDAANVDAQYRVTVTGKAPLYEGTKTSDAVTMTKAVGDAMTANPQSDPATDENTADGRIKGLNEENKYLYRKQNADETWPDTWTEVAENSTTIENCGPGNYQVCRWFDSTTHTPGRIGNVTVGISSIPTYAVNRPDGDGNGNYVRAMPRPAAENAPVTVTVHTQEGWELKGLTATKDTTGDEIELTKTEGKDDEYTFTMPASAVTLAPTFAKKTYTIEHNLTHISCNMAEHDHTATHGEEFSITLTPDEGFAMTPTTITVTNKYTGEEFRDYTYVRDVTDSAKRVLTFTHGVKCNIAIEGTAIPKTYTVDYSGVTNGLRAPNAPQNATYETDFVVTLEPTNGYALPERADVEVTVGGAAYENFTYEDGKITIPGSDVTGNIAITAAGVAQDLQLQTITMVGPARVDRTLTVNLVPVNAQVTYQWYYVEGEELTPIQDATNAQYNIVPGDVGKVICVKVTAVPGSGYAGGLTSEPTTPILPKAEPFVFVEKVTVDETASVEVGETKKLTAAVAPENATSPVLFWSSDNEAVATVDQDGVVTAVAEGTVTITAKATDQLNAALDTCTVTVTAAGTPVNPSRPSGNSGSTTTSTQVKEDGTKITTVTKPDGSKTVTVEQPDGTKSETATTKDGDVTITVTDENGEELVKAEIPATVPETETRFDDVPEDHWADEAIHNAAALKLVNGVGGNKFDMVSPMTRGSLATVLHRLSQGKTDYEHTFRDVAAGRFYTEGVAWAAKAGVVTGYTTEIFAPEDIITREQLAVMLARYAKLIGLDTTADAKSLDQFTDGDSTGVWAVDGVAWCVSKGILQGKGNDTLDPTADVSRAEVAVMLDRFIALLK